MVPATAASAAAITNVIEMVRSTSTPTSAAIFWSCSQARCARPSRVLATRYQNAASNTAVTPQMMSCLYDSVTGKLFELNNTNSPCTIGGIDLLRGPWVTCTKFDRKIDMPMAEINSASTIEEIPTHAVRIRKATSAMKAETMNTSPWAKFTMPMMP